MSETAGSFEREVSSSFLDQKIAETEEFWNRLSESGGVEEVDGVVVLSPTASEVEDFAEVTGDDNFAHVLGAEPENSRELAEMLSTSTSYTGPEIPEAYEEAGSYRPLQQGAMTPTALAYDDRLGFDGLLTNLELSFIEPVFAGLSRETADRTSIVETEDGFEVTAVNPWKGEEYVPTRIEYETSGNGDFGEENRRRIALLNSLVARGPVEGEQSFRNGDIFHSAEASYPQESLAGISYQVEGVEELSDTPLGPLKSFEAEDGDFSYSETYIDAEL